jgi:hypothetical protein
MLAPPSPTDADPVFQTDNRDPAARPARSPRCLRCFVSPAGLVTATVLVAEHLPAQDTAFLIWRPAAGRAPRHLGRLVYRDQVAHDAARLFDYPEQPHGPGTREQVRDQRASQRPESKSETREQVRDQRASWVSAYALTNDYTPGARLTSFARVHRCSSVLRGAQECSGVLRRFQLILSSGLARDLVLPLTPVELSLGPCRTRSSISTSRPSTGRLNDGHTAPTGPRSFRSG